MKNPTQPSLLQALKLVKPDTGRVAFAKSLQQASLAERANNSGSPSKKTKSKTSGSSNPDSTGESISERRAQTLRQLGPYQRTLKELWDGLTDTEKEQWEEVAKQSNAPLDEEDDGDSQIHQ
jgi:hypothetical protein